MSLWFNQELYINLKNILYFKSRDPCKGKNLFYVMINELSP